MTAPAALSSILQAFTVGELHNTSPDTPAQAVRDAVSTAIDAAWPQIREHFAQRLLTQNPDRDADFSAGVDWAADTIRDN